jgi:hypothetical protein
MKTPRRKGPETPQATIRRLRQTVRDLKAEAKTNATYYLSPLALVFHARSVAQEHNLKIALNLDPSAAMLVLTHKQVALWPIIKGTYQDPSGNLKLTFKATPTTVTPAKAGAQLDDDQL